MHDIAYCTLTHWFPHELTLSQNEPWTPAWWGEQTATHPSPSRHNYTNETIPLSGRELALLPIDCSPILYNCLRIRYTLSWVYTVADEWGFLRSPHLDLSQGCRKAMHWRELVTADGSVVGGKGLFKRYVTLISLIWPPLLPVLRFLPHLLVLTVTLWFTSSLPCMRYVTFEQPLK